MLSPQEALERNKPGIRPDVMELFSTFGQPAIEAYADQGLFHVTHSAYLDQIMDQGLRPDAEVIKSEDINFLAERFAQYGSELPFKRAEFVRAFMNFNPNQDAMERGVFLFPFLPYFSGLSMDFKPSYIFHGGPHIMRYFLRNMRYMVDRPNRFEDEERAHAQSLLDHYVEKLTIDNPRLVVLEVDPFAPAVINTRAWGNGFDLLEVSQMSPSEAVEIAKEAIGDRVEVRGNIPPTKLSVAEVRPISADSLIADTYEPGMVFLAPGRGTK